ncbi:hypothetical protein BJV82DRAFT_519139 [Fennellomyces sp. T-0311]|nr:hypothetical protein BJV82DRAFT_519139 [Fennellomyces sp. T-0311]
MTTTSTQTIELRETSLQQRHHTARALEQGPEHRLVDPLRLVSAKKSEEDIKRKPSRKVRKFYRQQNNLIDHILGPLNPIDEEEEQRQMLKVKIAVYGSGIANVMLFVLQMIAAISSGSLAIFATMADAFMDLLSSIVMMWAARQISKPNLVKYPAGKDRMETAAIMVNVIRGPKASYIYWWHNIGFLMLDDTGVKLLLFLYCVTLSQYSAARVFAQDHRNDLLVNGLGITTGILGSRLAGWVDAAGSIIIAVIILRSWISTLIEHTKLIVGKSADNDFLKRATYIGTQSLTHPGVHQVDTCRAYYAGNNLFVEVDIVLPPDTPLRDSHDIGESLQIKLESLPTVERAFVHVDYETSHRPEVFVRLFFQMRH